MDLKACLHLHCNNLCFNFKWYVQSFDLVILRVPFRAHNPIIMIRSSQLCTYHNFICAIYFLKRLGYSAKFVYQNKTTVVQYLHSNYYYNEQNKQKLICGIISQYQLKFWKTYLSETISLGIANIKAFQMDSREATGK